MKIQAGKEKVTIIPAKLTRNIPGKSANQKLRVVAYCRVSTDSEEQINSYKNQLAYYTEKINSKTEWKFAGKLYPGAHRQRERLNRLDVYKRQGYA